MQKVDRLGWAVGLSVKTYGVRIGIRSNDPIGLQRACQYFPHGWRPASDRVVDRLYSIVIGERRPDAKIRRFNLLYGDHVRIARSTVLDELFETFESDLRLLVAEFARRRVFVHAGVVGWKGRAIVIPARSFSGKSTLVAALVRAGATYYSDEFAVFDSQGRVHPFLKPIEIREKGGFKQSKVDVRHLGGRPGTKSLPVGLVVITNFTDGVVWRPRRLSAGRGLLELLSNTVSARRDPGSALTALKHVVTSAQVLKGTRGEAKDVAPAILESLAKSMLDLPN